MVRTNRIALLVTIIPIILLAIAIAVIGLPNPDLVETGGEVSIVDILLQVGFGLLVAAFISSIILASKGKREIAKGIRFGVVIGVVVLVIVFVVAAALPPQ